MDEQNIQTFIRQAAQTGQIKISLHAAEEAVEEEISRPEIIEALTNPIVVENYPDWWLGPCCLFYGKTQAGRDLHIVSSYNRLPTTIITVYEPKPPKWRTPMQRGDNS